jgi:hypothetical protein
MPIKEGFDDKQNKPFVKFGGKGTKYYFNGDSEKSHDLAVSKAFKQGAAIHIASKKAKAVEKTNEIVEKVKKIKK